MKKIVLIHGWSFKNYTKFGCVDAWENRKDFVKALATEFQIYKVNLPGFCGAQEPKSAWEIDDFVAFFENYLNSYNINPDYVLGYSFGAVIAVRWKKKSHKGTRLILISPALIRSYKKAANSMTDYLKKYLPKSILKPFRGVYLRFLKNEYYTQGTKFLKESYLNIVKIDLANELHYIPPEDLILIFGSEDTATPPNLLRDRLTDHLYLNRIKVINGGTHDIANSHIPNIMNLIKEFENED